MQGWDREVTTPGTRFEGRGHITSKALGRSRPEDLPGHTVLETHLQHRPRKRRELLTGVGWKLGGAIQARDSFQPENGLEMLGKRAQGPEQGWSPVGS